VLAVLAVAIWVVALCLLAYVGAVLLRGDKEPSRAVGDPNLYNPIEIEPHKVWEEYGSNALQADAKYAGKAVAFKVFDPKITKEADGRYLLWVARSESAAVTMDVYNRMSDREKKYYNEGRPPHVVGYISPGAEKPFAGSPKGSWVQVVGRLVGTEKAEGPIRGYRVVIEHCQRR
jgi:hypothetical protein